MPLTTDWTALHAKVDAMKASGYTNVTIGAVWGWHALTANAPLSQAAAPAPDLDKVVVVLTDGQNTQNRWWGQSQQWRIDARTEAVCTNMKAVPSSVLET